MERILNNTTKDENGCWNWNMSVSSNGYGQLRINGVYWSTHSYAYFTHHKIEKDTVKVVRHLCHNKLCCNPDHLMIGTQSDNWWDSEPVHREAAKKQRKTWVVDGVKYQTCREAVELTGISMNSIIKYTHDGVFDRASYEEGCRKGKRKSKK